MVNAGAEKVKKLGIQIQRREEREVIFFRLVHVVVNRKKRIQIMASAGHFVCDFLFTKKQCDAMRRQEKKYYYYFQH